MDSSRGHFGLANLNVQDPHVLLAYASNVPGLLWRERAPLFSRCSALQTRFCLCTQYCCNRGAACMPEALNLTVAHGGAYFLLEFLA